MNDIKKILLCVFAIAVFQGCKSTDDGGSILIKGRLVYDCSDRAHANEAITVTMITNHGFNDKETHDNVGSGTTDAQGNFAIACENHGVCDVYIKQTRLIARLNGGDGQTFELGNIYDRFTETALLKITFSTPHTDTLYIGNSDVPQASVYPTSGTQYVRLSNTSNFFIAPYRGDINLNYGYGLANFQAATNPPMINAEKAFKVCAAPDTVSVTLP